jgi:hypothetical protein
MDSALRASLRLSKVRARGATKFVAPVRRREQTLSLFATTPPHPGDFVAALTPTYWSLVNVGRALRADRPNGA